MRNSLLEILLVLLVVLAIRLPVGSLCSLSHTHTHTHSVIVQKVTYNSLPAEIFNELDSGNDIAPDKQKSSHVGVYKDILAVCPGQC